MSALTLRIIACFCMLLDHIGYLLSPRYPFLIYFRWAGRLAFPIYTFLIVNGVKHTSSRWRYALRLAIMAVISQIPFSLALYGKIYTAKWNVFVTLLLSMLVIWASEELKKRKLTWLAPLLAAAVSSLFFLQLLQADYGKKGILLAMVFWLCADRPVWMLPGAILALFPSEILKYSKQAVLALLGKAHHFAPLSLWAKTQFFSLAAFIPIWLYNGKPGPQPRSRDLQKAVQLGFYLFYPVHLILLYFLIRA